MTQNTFPPVRTAIIGCGVISDIYLTNLTRSPSIALVAVADLIQTRAEEKAARFGIPRATTVDAVLSDPSIELIVNLTVPAAHGTVALGALRSGKSVYNEKPLAISREDARLILNEAAARGLEAGAAPDTVLGAGYQTTRQLLAEGVIGRPVAAAACMLSRGPDQWHPDPAFLFKQGAGPLFDMGPYYLTALITLFGPIARVSGATRITHPTRTVMKGPKAGERFTVDAPSHVAALVEFASGPVATLVTSFDLWEPYRPSIEVFGTRGTLIAPDPNTFGGPITVRNADDAPAITPPLTHPHTENSRGLGVIEMAAAIRSGRPHRANAALAYHVLDAMHGIIESAQSGRHVALEPVHGHTPTAAFA
ncbi:MAG: Gfo/Idh/MocA family oxidoreductase [Thermoflexales bacterium]|nr:Gfo/Idh/MocA family oxidoreductase [Thermoflexales bacterium]